jgi:hypothetical protein
MIVFCRRLPRYSKSRYSEIQGHISLPYSERQIRRSSPNQVRRNVWLPHVWFEEGLRPRPTCLQEHPGSVPVPTTHHEKKTIPLKDTSSICAFSGNNFSASSTLARLIVSVPLLLAFSAVALRRIGLLLIFVRRLIKASDSAVELWMRLSSLSGWRIFEKIESCKAVGVTKTTYSSVTWKRFRRNGRVANAETDS